jgi:hypothetical protein
MAIIYGAVGVLFAVYLLLRISRMLGATKTTVEFVPAPQPQAPTETFHDDRFNTAPLPERSASELAEQANALKSEWVTYNGFTPPLKLLIKGQSYESYRRVARSQIKLLGQQNVERLSSEQMADFNRSIVARAYVGDWEGAQYPNGNAMPFSPENLRLLMAKDPYLESFITNEAKRVSPPWPAQ